MLTDLEAALDGIIYPTTILEHTANIEVKEEDTFKVSLSISSNPFAIRTWVQYTDESGKRYYGGERILPEPGDKVEDVIDFAIARALRYSKTDIVLYEAPNDILNPAKGI